ncbi:MAG: AarF/ABC1/UbiB kinase family protein [Gluconobacter potus]|uniref:AarF/ABC1/UbiB kinase family protein n=1 Tax=Gluconobacter potus TaxID=2724927 RepID=A0ABR9YLH0_9PROT|nr:MULTISPECIES: AarF/ABC1/UbiB kinase family protein [Gluconobacter]MBF0864638.1 AarF/ABC1/UbiB kinase family protein [Gluconobacter sp. R71656]MBF0866968.1 AarF/ABC1/UbiB kinase family protein [Gluconobacter sp. R75628]MBF0873155.1 AarF/ABC1/UbiB kinase family protein [Gluconobacter sp. R75629]MBF0882644.1 AarF/ABC1/UbiB kinase family protein [Gluconobacter potus]
MARDLDNTGLMGELRRMARTSGAVGGIAARMAGSRLGFKTDKGVHAEGLKSALGNLKGPLMKAAQLLSTIPGALPDEYAEELAHLQSNAPPMGWSFVRRRMQAELGAGWEKHFRSFSHEAVAAASLGQVHRARLADGREVACKLQYPDMQAAVDSDLRQFRAALGIYRQFETAIRQDEVYTELADRLREELDYRREASHLRLYRDMLANTPEVTVPAPVEALSTGRLLTMDWVSGRSMRTVLGENLPQEDRNAMATALFKAWYTPVYRYGVIHGDPHMGNFTVRDDYGLNLLDFGAVRIFSPRFVEGVIDLFTALRENNEELAFHAYSKWGFQGISRETANILNEWARFFYRPLMTDRVCSMQESNDPAEARQVLEKVYDGLKRTGGVKLPREFVLMDRSAIGLGSAFLRLEARLNWHRMFEELIEGFDVNVLAQRQQEALAKAKVPPALSSL